MESVTFSDMVHLKKLELLYFLPEMTLFEKCCVSFYLDSVSAMCSMVMISLSTFLARSIRSQKNNSHCRCVFFPFGVLLSPRSKNGGKKTVFFQRVSWFFDFFSVVYFGLP